MFDNSKDHPGVCESCEFNMQEVQPYTINRHLGSREDMSERNTHKWLCILCASTMAGNAFEYPEQYPERDVLQAICFVGNAILANLSASSMPAEHSESDEIKAK